jgi:heme o synthase
MSAFAVAVPRAVSVRDLVVLLKVRIDALVVCVALAAAVAAGVRAPGVLAVLAGACFAASAGASALNHYFERESDALMHRTRGRPLPSGRVPAAFALALGVTLIAASQAAVPVLGLGASLYLLAGAATYAVVYTRWLKRRTPYGIVFGGAAGSFAALAGWQTGATTLAAAPLLLAAVLFLWTPSHFWSLAITFEDDYRRANVPMLPVVAGARRAAAAVHANTVGLVVASLVLAPFVGVAYAIVAVPAGVWFLAGTRALARHADKPRAWTTFKASGLYLLSLLAGLVLSTL